MKPCFHGRLNPGVDRTLLELPKIKHPGENREPVHLFDFNKVADKSFEFRQHPEIYMRRCPTALLPVFASNHVTPAEERFMGHGKIK